MLTAYTGLMCLKKKKKDTRIKIICRDNTRPYFYIVVMRYCEIIYYTCKKKKRTIFKISQIFTRVQSFNYYGFLSHTFDII